MKIGETCYAVVDEDGNVLARRDIQDDAEYMFDTLGKERAACRVVPCVLIESATLARLKAENERMRECLKRTEWSDGFDRCPECGAKEIDGHAYGCELAALIESEGGK